MLSEQHFHGYNPFLGIVIAYQGNAGPLLLLFDSTNSFDIAENSEIVIEKRIPCSNIFIALRKVVNPQSKSGEIPGRQEFTPFLNERNPSNTLVGSRAPSHITPSA